MTTISSSIISALGSGSGIDTAALVSNLVAATREPKETAITSKQTVNNARISALASASSALDNFSTALTKLLEGAGYSGQPASNDTSIATVSLLTGGTPSGLPAQLEVVQLATAQTLESPTLASASTAVGLGTLTLTTASGAQTITIDSSNNTLSGLASAINSANAGVTASVVTDNQGSRLILKGATGEANSFTLTAGTADTDLQRFTFDGTSGGMTQKVAAADSIIRIDNIEMHNSSNTIDTAIPYVRIDLNKAQPGTSVTLASTEPTTSIRELVVEYVDAYNTLRQALNEASAPGSEDSSGAALASDSGIRYMKQQLATLTSTKLASSGTYQSLADLGISTNRDGTLTLDTTRLDKALAADPTAITQMLNPAVSSDTNPGIAGALKKVRDAIQGDGSAFKASQAKYDALKTTLTAQLEKLDTEMDNYEARLTTTYSKLETQLTALKATQSYLEQQIDAWNNSDS